jgi:hypothetical protein
VYDGSGSTCSIFVVIHNATAIRKCTPAREMVHLFRTSMELKNYELTSHCQKLQMLMFWNPHHKQCRRCPFCRANLRGSSQLTVRNITWRNIKCHPKVKVGGLLLAIMIHDRHRSTSRF